MPEPITERIAELAVVPVVEVDDADCAVALARALVEGGLPIVEITFRTPAAADALCAIREQVDDILLAAGTVTTIDQVRLSASIGVDLLIAPGTSPWVLDAAGEAGIAMIPGVSTPSDVERALRSGAQTVKLFPAAVLGGVGYLNALCAPYPDVRWMPTGGISAASLPEYLAHPAVIACAGSWMAPREEIRAGRFEAIAERARQARGIAQGARV